ncbi:glycosyltransferase [Shewanella sp. 10N.286.48.A6]|uniref:glycosyltransferase n=1 Tax=Shewanella sp. 10N.286.48.A6 TaxID=1880833 RepID=UPI000C8618A9|nr:glycosyltransferase [Shewanella sp. 10N.286.48.A6]PMI02837.1 hypothetical protein BCU55_04455 [Shewanella sp. 10N.286.48.A6]
MKILLFMPSFRGGGAEKVFVNLANYFSSTHQVILAVSQNEGPNLKRVNRSIKVISYDCNSVWKTTFKHRKLIKEEKPDVVFSNTVSCNAVSFLVKVLLNNGYSKFIGREANIVNGNSLKMIFRNKLSYFLYRFSDGFVFNSDDTFESIKHVFPNIVKYDYAIISNPVISELVDVEKSVFEGKSNSLSIISVGRLSEQKNYLLSLKTVSYLKSQGTNVIFDIYGVGDLLQELMQLTKELEIEDCVNFKGYSDDILSIYKDYNVFLITSKWEGFGNVIVEALSAGLPVVATNSRGGVPELINNSSYGAITDFNEICIGSAIVHEVDSDSKEKIILRKQKANKFTTSIIGAKYLEFLLNVKK